ncbi:MAG TPA: site-specific integrase, partial [Chloroflexota bacterium]|nr:site-specific integrase [Chloroflexota bacterium]
PGLGRVRLVQLTTPRTQAFLNERHEAGLSPKTVKHLRDLSRAALNDAEEWGYIVRNPAKWPTHRASSNTALSR